MTSSPYLFRAAAHRHKPGVVGGEAVRHVLTEFG